MDPKMWFCINLEYIVVSYWNLEHIGYYVNCTCIYILVRAHELDLLKISRIKTCIYVLNLLHKKKNFVQILGTAGLAVYFVNGTRELPVIALHVFH